MSCPVSRFVHQFADDTPASAELDFKVDLPGDPTLWISLATAPLLVGLIGGRVVADTIRQLGLASEEIFRGDRLPLLDWSFQADDPTAPPGES